MSVSAVFLLSIYICSMFEYFKVAPANPITLVFPCFPKFLLSSSVIQVLSTSVFVMVWPITSMQGNSMHFPIEFLPPRVASVLLGETRQR